MGIVTAFWGPCPEGGIWVPRPKCDCSCATLPSFGLVISGQSLEAWGELNPAASESAGAHGPEGNSVSSVVFGVNICWDRQYVVLVQSLSCVQLFETPWTTAHQAPLSSMFCS